MRKSKKYETEGLREDQFEIGSKGRVLKNSFGINKKHKIDQLEIQEYLRTIQAISKLFNQRHCFTAQDICRIHEIWLGRIYPWAGQYRQVNVSKGGFSFAAAKYIPTLMDEFEKNALQKFTPCCYKAINEIIQALAIVHTELLLIHPFRDGNGRLARLIAILMGWQAGLPTLDFGGVVDKKKREYFLAVQAGMNRDYRLMENIFDSIVKRTLRKAKK